MYIAYLNSVPQEAQMAKEQVEYLIVLSILWYKSYDFTICICVT
jgi:hypothetical protein